VSFSAVHPISVADIADAIETGLKKCCAELDAEQAVYGLDSLDEIQLHPYLERSLREGGFGVYREQRYPAHRRQRALSAGDRCDFVLTPGPAPGRPLVMEESRGTLFDDPDAIALDEAFWLEVKVVSQFTPDGPNAGYSSQLLSTVRQDVTKLARDDGILHAALLIVLFVREQLVADHDLRIWQDKCLERGLPIGAPACRSIPIADRHGNAHCAIATYPVAHL
jgi:hypothetical protein